MKINKFIIKHNKCVHFTILRFIYFFEKLFKYKVILQIWNLRTTIFEATTMYKINSIGLKEINKQYKLKNI